MEASWSVVLLRTGVQLLAFPVYLLWYLGLWGPFCKMAFPYIMARIAVCYNEKMSAKKKELFSNLKDFTGPSGVLTLLEIGAGSGSNFEFYPAGCRLICNDNNDNFSKHLDKSLSQNPHLQLQQRVIGPAEDLPQIPNASVDVVVCTLVLCSVESTERVLKEVLRVLRPGGAFYFMEHVAGAPFSWSLFWQQIYDPVWQILFDGCHLARETWRDLEKAGFSELKLWHTRTPLKWNPAQPHIIGYAVKFLIYDPKSEKLFVGKLRKGQQLHMLSFFAEATAKPWSANRSWNILPQCITYNKASSYLDPPSFQGKLLLLSAAICSEYSNYSEEMVQRRSWKHMCIWICVATMLEPSELSVLEQ